ncbi:MAG: hypothetical protein ACLT0Y_01625 [Christensenellales bacterium]
MATQSFSFQYGRQTLSFSIENARSIEVLSGRPIPPIEDLDAAFCTP